jgi:hypothetical protein
MYAVVETKNGHENVLKCYETEDEARQSLPAWISYVMRQEKAFGIKAGTLKIKKAEAKAEQPSPKEQYETMSEAEQIQADLAWIDMGGWLSEKGLARLRDAGYKV